MGSRRRKSATRIRDSFDSSSDEPTVKSDRWFLVRLLLEGRDLAIWRFVASLLGLEHEAAALVKVDPFNGRRAVGIEERHCALEHISVLVVVKSRRVGAGDREQVASLVPERRIVRSLRRARVAFHSAVHLKGIGWEVWVGFLPYRL